MTKKLTLTIDPVIIKQAKTYARKRNTSVSRIVEEYLDHISSGGKGLDLSGKLESPITDSLVGMFKDPGKEYETLLEEALAEKHL
jgi:hypothetical protein